MQEQDISKEMGLEPPLRAVRSVPEKSISVGVAIFLLVMLICGWGSGFAVGKNSNTIIDFDTAKIKHQLGFPEFNSFITQIQVEPPQIQENGSIVYPVCGILYDGNKNCNNITLEIGNLTNHVDQYRKQE